MKKLVGYITASYPENSFTVDLALSMKEAGVDTLELGIPFSDPVADGPVIEKANLLALENNFSLEDLFDVSSKIAPQMDTLWMGYLNPFFHYGMEEFFKKAKDFNIQGEIIPDLPYEEALAYKDLAKKYEQSIITFVAPTHTEDRIAKIVKDAEKFIYMVAYAGITGSGKNEDLTQIIKTVKKYSNTPLYIGFGVDEKTCKEKAVGVDGVIVGSAFVKHIIDDSLSYNEKISNITKIAKEIKEKINE
ncbi:tryptophan synthase subunit alpha [Arcobacter sp. CECT 8986]|uniref:tryptophan synthase subunit alpha n=1 Tax=Arcobacter sp. CECT 8986 TaxID=2044507 RepID=UPI001009E97F|nr:tryptophan synthase subunit alpha [Arcobacter sp. CECT 8986]RXJ99564.1 tryptophan synthase subunit alpha [Arcobacter sp. CECT 8986]